MDTTAADMLEDLDLALNERGISLAFAEMSEVVQEKIHRYELTRTIDPEHFYPTINAALRGYAAAMDEPQVAPPVDDADEAAAHHRRPLTSETTAGDTATADGPADRVGDDRPGGGQGTAS